MVKSILKRILVGVGVALALMFIKGNLLMDVHAAATGSALLQGQSVVVSNLDTGSSFSYSGGTWANWGRGTLYGSISLMKVNGSSTAPPVTIRQVQATSGSGLYVCDLGSVVTDNSTFENQSYTIKCPMTLGSYGFDGLNIIYADNQQNEQSQYRVRVKDLFTFVQENDFQFNSSDIITSQNQTRQAINQQTQDIINNNNSNTQAIINSNNQTKDSVDDLNDTLKDDSIDSDNAEDTISDLNSQLATNGSISQLITLPIQLFRGILNQVDNSCSPFNLGSLYGHDLIMPCIDLQSLLGSTLYNIIDVSLVGLFILSFRKKMVDIFNHMTSLNDRGNELE